MSWNQEERAESQEQIARAIAKRRAQGEALEVLTAPKGSKKLCQNFWSQAWCRHLELYQHYEARLPAGRSYLRQGKVMDLDIQPGVVTAVVAGEGLFDPTVRIRPLDAERWADLVKAAEGKVGSLLDLLAGRLGDDLIRTLTEPESGLFPEPGEIRFDCDCPDYADLCKHSAAVLYGIGVLLDTRPELLFTLRGVDQADLLATARSSTAAGLEAGAQGGLEGADLSALFGIDLSKD